MRTAAVILARAGSKGIPAKNLAKINGHALIARSVMAAHSAWGVTAGVWVSTDGPAIAAEAKAYGAQVIGRPDDLASDTASSEAGWLHALHHIRRAEPDLDRLVFLQCTSPFTTGADIDACLAAQSKAGAACALSVIPTHGFLWRATADGTGVGVNHEAAVPRLRRQDLAPQYLESGAIYTVEAAAFEAAGNRFCGRVALCPVDHPPVEIDGPDDLVLVRALAHQREGRADDHSTGAPWTLDAAG